MSSKRARRVTRVVATGTVALNLLVAGGCADFGGGWGSGGGIASSEPTWQSRRAFKPVAAAPARVDFTRPELHDSSGGPTASAAFAQSGAAAAGADTILTSTETRWANEPHDSGRISNINMFGEMKGAPPGGFKPAGNSGYQQHTVVEEGEDSDVAVDPTGKWLAFTSTRHNEAGDIYLQRVDGTSVTQLTNDAARDAYPTFSQDGKWIAFASTRNGTWQIYRMDLDGRNVVAVTQGPMQCIHPSFSPDGTRLVYSALSPRSDQWELWTVNLLTDEKRQVGYGLFPSWSPDPSADRIAYQRGRQRGSRWFSLWTMEIQGGEGRRTTEVAVSSNAAIVTPCWSPDGKKLAFTTVVQPTNGANVSAGQQDIWMIDADGTNKHRLTDGNGTNLTPAWAVNNRVYFVSNRGGNEAVWSVHADAVDAFTAAAKAFKAPTHAGNGKRQDPFETADTSEANGH
jgi:TolB protein